MKRMKKKLMRKGKANIFHLKTFQFHTVVHMWCLCICVSVCVISVKRLLTISLFVLAAYVCFKRLKDETIERCKPFVKAIVESKCGRGEWRKESARLRIERAWGIKTEGNDRNFQQFSQCLPKSRMPVRKYSTLRYYINNSEQREISSK